MIAPSHHATAPGTIAGHAGGELVLYIDPDPKLCREVASHLANSGYRVMTTCHSLDAVQMLIAQRAEVDVVVFDSAMPTLDGMPLARALHMVSPKLPLFILVSATGPAPFTADTTINIRGLVQKPAEVAALRAALTTALSSMRLR